MSIRQEEERVYNLRNALLKSNLSISSAQLENNNDNKVEEDRLIIYTEKAPWYIRDIYNEYDILLESEDSEEYLERAKALLANNSE